MDVRTLLRAALVPLGLAIAARGIEDLRTEADELRQLVDERRAYLAGDGPLPDVDEPEPAAPEDLRHTAELEDRPAEGSPVRHVVAGVAGLVAGVLVGRMVGRWARRATVAALTRDEQAAAYAAAAFRGDVDPRTGVVDGATSAAFRRMADVDEHQDVAHQLVDEQDGDDFPHRNTAAAGSAADPCVCPDCGWIAPAGDPMTRRTSLALHRNGHAAGLPGR